MKILYILVWYLLWFGVISWISYWLDWIWNINQKYFVKNNQIVKGANLPVQKQKKEVAPVQKFKPLSLSQKISDYVNQNTMKCIDLDLHYWCQCVDQVKHFVEKIYWKKLGYFWYAREWFQKKSMCWADCKKTIWAKGIKVWDMVFFKPYQKFKNGWETWQAWHVASVINTTETKVLVVEQNTRTGKGWWKVWDRVQTNWYLKSEVGWFISFS